ncbi:MAG: protein kinase, partial [Planctomycetaceae bacterium]|nr:protein kinase [Planctomycetaceae bacterium]
MIDLNELSDCDGSAVGTDLPSLQHHAGFTIPGELRLGEFELQEELGRGGMGVVFKAQHLKTGAIFALKVLSPLNSRDGTLIERFRREAEAASRLNHGSFVRVDSFGREKGYYYYVMEYIAGRDLAEVVRCLRRAAALGRNRLHELSEILPFLLPTGDCPSTGNQRFFHWVACLGKQVADALEYAHKNGVIHRDIKPSNLILDPDGRIRITDLGLARIVDEASVTGTGDIVGTLRYMSPEQLRAGHRRIDQRTDIYSLGVTIYELISLAPLFPESDRERLIERILFTEPIKLRTQSPEVPQDLDAIVMRCLAKSPTDRYHTSQELADDLGRFLRGERIAPRTFHRIRHNLRSLSRRLWMIIAALLLGAALWLVADSFRHHPTKQGQFGREGLDTEWTDPRLERNRVQYLVTNSALSQGLLELERGQSADGMLWFGKALELVDSGTRLEALIRRNINGWERELAPLTDFQTISDVPLDSPSVVATSENYLAVAEKDQVTVWGLSGNIRPVARRQLKAPLTGIDLVGNDPHLLMATGDGVVEVWNFHSDEIARHSFPKAKQIRHLECSDDGMSLLTTLTDEGISIWRLED